MRATVSISILLWLLGAPARADESWSVDVRCPESGSSFPCAHFDATTLSGFTSNGICARTSSGFTRFDFQSHNNGTLNSFTLFGLHVGDLLIMPPVLNTETNPIFTVPSGCPYLPKSLNWIWVQWGSAPRDLVNDNVVAGLASYSPTAGVSVTGEFNVQGSSVWSGSLAMSGSCSNGVYSTTGTGSRAGKIYFTSSGRGDYKADNGTALFFVPRVQVRPSTDLGSLTFPGIMFDGNAAVSTRQVRVTTNASGLTWTVALYADPQAGTIDAAYTDTITIDTPNQPASGFLHGTVSRSTGGTGQVLCMFDRATTDKMICSGQSPNDNTMPLTLTFARAKAQVLGQPTPNTILSLERGVHAEGVYTDGTRLFVADSYNDRVLIYNSLPSASGAIPDIVLGQPSLEDGQYEGATARSMYYPSGVYYDGTRLFVADTYNNRVLIWNSLPTYNWQPADHVLGQPDMTSSDCYGGDTIDGTNFCSPDSVVGDGTHLVVTDNGTPRVLIWNQTPTTDNVPADVVLGQTSMTTDDHGGAAEINEHVFRSVGQASISQNHLFVADFGNKRVLVWNSIPTSNFQAADVVIGQSDFTSNGWGFWQNGFGGALGVWAVGSRVFISDFYYNRVMVWRSIPTSNGAWADYVLGQGDFTTWAAGDSNPNGHTLSGPSKIASDGTHLFVIERQVPRILMWKTMPDTNAADADYAIGKPSLTDIYFSPPSSQTIPFANSVSGNGTKLVVSDAGDNRVMIWNSPPTANYQAADVIIGWPNASPNPGQDFINPPPASDKTFNYPEAAWVDRTHLFVADSDNTRVLIWNTIPTNNTTGADVVLNWDNFNSGRFPDYNNLNAGDMDYVVSGSSDNTRLAIADNSINRVLIWNQIPTTNHQYADVVVGQPDFQSYDSSASASTFVGVNSVLLVRGMLIVADDCRVLIWKRIPTTNGAPADVVLGQPDKNTDTCTFAPPFNNKFHAGKLASDGKRLFLTDGWTARVLVWDNIPTVDNTPPDAVLGQPDLSTDEGYDHVSSRSLGGAVSVWSDGSQVYVADDYISRIVIFDAP